MKFSWLTIVAPRAPSSRATYAPAKPPPRTSTPPFASRSGMWTFYQPRLEEGPLDLRRREIERSPVRGVGLVPAPEPAEQVGAGRVEEVVVVEALDRLDEPESLLEPVCEGDGDGAVQLDDGGGREVEKPRVEEGNLRPVDRLVGVERGDCRLQLVGARDAECKRAVERCAALLDLGVIPERAILILEEHKLAFGGDAGVSPRVLEEQQRVKPVRLGLVGHERREQEREADGLGAEVAADRGAVA